MSKALSDDEAAVLELCRIPRRAGDVAFLHGERGGLPASTERALANLERLGLVSEAEGFWSLTDAGIEAVRPQPPWMARVDNVFKTSMRSRPLVVCRDVVGPVQAGDWFVVNGASLGRVQTVELPPRGAPLDALTVTVDVEVKAGDRLVWTYQPDTAGEALAQLLAGYFHQDWDIEHEDEKAVLASMTTNEPPYALARAAEALHDRLVDLDTDEMATSYLGEVGCYCSPAGSSLQWLRDVYEQLVAAGRRTS